MVKRYVVYAANCICDAPPNSDGQYVLVADYDALAARLADVSGMLVEAWTLMVDGKVADDFGDRLQQWIDTRQPSEKRVTTRATDSASGGAE